MGSSLLRRIFSSPHPTPTRPPPFHPNSLAPCSAGARAKYETQRIGQFKAFPIRLATCLTIALAQGSQFDCNVVVHFPTFVPDTWFGSAYVALSRVTDVNKLFVDNLTPFHVKVDPPSLA